MPRILVAIALLCLLSAPSASNGLNWEEIDADAVVDRCWGISREDRDRGVTARMRAGTVDTIDCFAEKIARHAEVFFDPRSMTEAEVRQALEEIGAAYGKLYWVMHNAHKGCKPSCGTVHHVFHVGALASLYEKILRDLVRQRNEYRE